jgi:hypothetical protein
MQIECPCDICRGGQDGGSVHPALDHISMFSALVHDGAHMPHDMIGDIKGKYVSHSGRARPRGDPCSGMWG